MRIGAQFIAAALIRDAEATAVLQDDDLLQQEEMITLFIKS